MMGKNPLSPVQFRRRFRRLILLSWLIPPAFGTTFLVLVNVFSQTQMKMIMMAPWVNLFVVITLGSAYYILERYIRPVPLAMEGRVNGRDGLERMRRFPLLFWGLFLGTLILAPSVVMLTAKQVLPGYQPDVVDWFRIHLVALIVSIAVGLPIFFRILDLFGHSLSKVKLGRPHLTIKLKVFLIGALVPLLIDTILIQYFWAKTGYFTTETVLLWLLLELLAIAGSLLFVNSFSQSLAPLQRMQELEMSQGRISLDDIHRCSTDELGTLTEEMVSLFYQRDTIEEQIIESEQELRGILNNMQDVHYRTDTHGLITRVTPSVKRFLGYEREELLGRPLADLYADEGGYEQFLATLQSSGGQISNCQARLKHKDGHYVWVSTNAQYYRDAKGQILGVEGVGRDITDRILAENALSQEREYALVTLNAIGDGVVSTAIDGRINYLNPVAERLLQVEMAKAVGRPVPEMMTFNDRLKNEAVSDLLHNCLDNGIGGKVNNAVMQHRDGEEFIIKVTAAPLRSQHDEIIGAVLVLQDVTEIMGVTRQLNYQATHDMLTGLYNRTEFENRLDSAIRSARRQQDHVLFYMDLDQFKIVNDTCGHQAGDELLIQLATLLQYQLRETDTLARLGGDEFGVLLENCPLENAMSVAEKLRQVVKEFRFVWQDKSFEIGVSIGVVPLNPEYDRIGEVLRAADAACYVAKELGRNRTHIYEPEDDNVARHHGQMEWVTRITQAFEENRFVLYAQPIVPTAEDCNATPHYEVLMRIVENDQVVTPMAFIPAAERYNLMPILDRWVVRTTLGLLRQAQGPHPVPPIHCGINLSGQSLNEDAFLEFVLEQFEETGVPYESICFEITETAAIAHLSRAMRFISVLGDHGCTFALDDFGSGLSSFGYLKNLNVHFLKIDGSFIMDMMEDSADRAMVASINNIGHVLGLQTIAEFVENEETRKALEIMGIDYIQGYIAGKPVPLTKVLG